MNRRDYTLDVLRHALTTVALITVALIATAFISTNAVAQIKADPTAPGNQRPTVLVAPNGVPVVNIQTPSTAGVSRNTYSDFNVDPNGAILNNSRTDTQTQLGGWIQGNPWLAKGGARIILNEVNSTNPSLLNGWIEIAGKRAQIVIANPAGITCKGCGFINATNTTLSTGTPIVNRGNLEGYVVKNGMVQIDTLGLDASQADALTILARSAEINAGIWAQKLSVITGINDIKVDADGNPTNIAPIILTPIAGSHPGRANGHAAPPFALDVAYLGGMYAGHIFIYGTEEGLGTRNLGALNATQELTLNTAGWLDVKGSINAPKLALKADQLTNTGSLAASQLVADINQSVTNTGGLIIADTLQLKAQSIDNTRGEIIQVGTHDLDIQLTGELKNNLGLIATNSTNVSLTANRIDNTGGQIVGMGNVNAKGGEIINDAGLIQSGQALTLDTNGQTLTNSNSGNDKGLVSADQLTITASTLDNQTGYIGSGKNTDIHAQQIDNRRGLVFAENLLHISTDSLTNGAANSSGHNDVTQDGKLLSRRDIDIGIHQDYTHRGLIYGDGNVSLTTNGSLENQGKLIAGNVFNATATTLTNTVLGSIEGNAIELHATGDHTLVNRGLINGETVFLTSPTIQNLGTGRLYGDHLVLQGDTILNASETINNITSNPVIAARDRLDIGVGTLDNRDDALILSGGDAAIGRWIDTRINPNTGQPYYTATGIADTINNDSATIDIQGNADINAVRINNRNTHLTITQIDEDKFREQRLLVSRTNKMYPASQCGGLGGWREAYCIVHPELYGQRQTIKPVRDPRPVFCLGGCGPEVINYAWNDPLFARFNVTPVGPPPAEPAVPYGVNSQGKPGGCNGYIGGAITTPECVAWRKQYKEWDVTYQAALDALSIPVNAYNASVNEDNRLHIFEDYTWYDLTGNPSRSQVTNTTPSLIRVGSNLNITGDGTSDAKLTNQDSQIIVGGNINFADSALNNQETKGTYRVQYKGTAEFTTIETCGTFGDSHCREWHGKTPYNPAPEIKTIDLPTGARYVIHTTSNSTNTTPNNYVKDSNATTVAYNDVNQIALPNNALFKVDAHPGEQPIGGYLVETDTAYTNYRKWLSSDYLLSAISMDPAMTQKRLGDGYYEQSLIRDQVAQLTGRRFLDGYSNDEEEYLALMRNGATVASNWNLRPGIALTKEQVAQLTSDIVWLVDQTVTLADGSTTNVLVPQLYVRLREGDLAGNGTLISGNSINANVSGDLTNSGTIAGRTAIRFTADNINNLAGRIQGINVNLQARVDINNLGGRITAQNSLIAQAARDVNIESTTQSSENIIGSSRFTRTGIDRVAGLYVTGNNAYNNNGYSPSMVVTAGNNATFKGAQIINNGTGKTHIQAGQDLKLSALTTSQDDKAVWDAKNHSRLANRQDIGTQIETQGAITLQSGRDITARASNVTSQGAINAQAGRDIRLEAGQSQSINDQARHYTTSGTLSSTTTTTRDLFDQTNSVASSLSGNSVNVRSERDVVVQGSTVVADADVNVKAGRDINVISATNTHIENHYKDEKTSGVMGSGGFGVTVGSRQLSNDQKTNRTTASASSIASLGTDNYGNAGNVNLDAGRSYQQTGSDVLALKGDINIAAQNVTINEARETQRQDNETKFKQSGITVAISTPILTAIQTVDQMSQAAGNTSDGRMQALAAATSALAVGRAANAVMAGQGKTINGKANQIVTGTNPDGTLATRDATAADKLGGVDVSVSFGSSKSHSKSSQTSDTSARSRVVAGNNVNIIAKNDPNASAENKAENNNLNIQGSQIQAGNTATLVADDEVNLLAAKQTAHQRSKNNSSSGSVGMSFGSNGTMFNIAGSQGRGRADGDDVTWANTEVKAGQKVHIGSGTNTTIRGAVVSGKEVDVNVGTRDSANGSGSLTIESLQDTSTYNSKQQNVGGSLSVGAGKMSGNISINHSKIKNDYASVNQQSGIHAGDGGFHVAVEGDTTLQGGAITSTDKAVNDGNNSFTTGGQLTTSDINNKANYQADSVGVNVGTGFSPSGSLTPQGTGVGVGSDGKKESSTTLAAITGIAGNKAARTGDKEAALANTFNAEKVQKDIDAQVVITQTFGTLASKAVGDFSQSQLNQAKTLREEAGQETDPTRAQSLRDQAQQIEANWGDQGTARLTAHTVVGALTGGTAGALGAAASTLSAPLISDTLAKAGVDPALSKILTAVSSTALGSAAGSATGGASGSTAGAAGALNEVANNYLSHSEALKREIALQQKQACTTDECRASAQRTINELNQVDAWRDAQLQTACATPSSSLCQGLNSALQIAKDSYNNYDPKSDINSTVAGERSQVNNQTFKYQQRVDNPFAYGVGKGLLKLSPPALVADVGYGAYSLTTAILENGLESTAINIAKSIADLPGELRARLNSNDPSTRGEALVDFIALGSGTAYLTQKLGLAVVNTADQAITKTTAKIAAKQDYEQTVIPLNTINIDKKGNALIGTWSDTITLSAPENASGHWKKHSVEFPEYENASQYVERAQSMIANPPSGVLIKNRANGDVMLYDPLTNTFVVSDKTGAPRTMFRPTDGIKYWNKQ